MTWQEEYWKIQADRDPIPAMRSQGIRLIRAYEQSTVALPHAEAGTVARLVRALMCDMERSVGGNKKRPLRREAGGYGGY